MATVAGLRQGYVNSYLHRADGSSKPWSDAELDRLIADALAKLWPRFGVLSFGDVATDQQTDYYSVPGALLDNFRIHRIELVTPAGRTSGRVTSWRLHDGLKIQVKPIFATGNKLRVYAWVPFAVDGSDLPTDLEETVSHRAAGRAYGNLAAELVNSERQQNLDTGRVVSYQDAVGFAAYHERLYEEGLIEHPNRVVTGPRRARRG